jgi:hypothetical protein
MKRKTTLKEARLWPAAVAAAISSNYYRTPE